MLVGQIIQFILNLHKAESLTPFDAGLLSKFKTRFLMRDLQAPLLKDDVEFILDHFKSRWQEVIGKEHDYLLNPAGVNKHWILLAKDLAPSTDKNFLQILLPTITNKCDFNSLTALTETQNLDNFFLGEANVLYRKRSFCERLMEEEFALSIVRSLQTKTLGTLTVEELTRLKSCKQVNGEFTITFHGTGEVFASFWDFLKRKVFPKLQSKGKQPVELLPKLLVLVEEYFALKNAKADFNLFRKLRHDFFIVLSSYDLDQINFFYGNTISHNGQRYYLLDFLIAIQTAQSYNIDEQLYIVLAWLTPPQDIIECKSFILSLFLVDLSLTFANESIGLWDKTKLVCSEAARLYIQFEKLLTDNKSTELIEKYSHIKKELRSHSTASTSFFGVIKNPKIDDWHEHAKKGTLSEINVHWFEPERLMHALLRVHLVNPESMKLLNEFVDEIIRTYAQSNSQLLKEFRINIIFPDILKKLSASDQRQLLTIIALYPIDEVKHSFISNCNYQIVRSLSRINIPQSGGSPHFFLSLERVESSDLFIPNPKSGSVRALIQEYNDKLHSSTLQLNNPLLTSMSEHLLKLSRPILTTQEIKQAEDSANTLDYLGSPT